MTYPPGEPPAPSSQPFAGPGAPEPTSSPAGAGPVATPPSASGATGPGSAPPFGAPAPAAQTRTAAEITAPLRPLAALVLVAANAVLLLLAVIDLVTAVFSDDFLGRSGALFSQFVGIVPITAPLLAVLLVTHVRPVHRQARLITSAALVEYGVSTLFGVICLLTGFVHQVSTGNVDSLTGVWDGFETLVARVAMAALFAVAAFVVVRVYQELFAAPKPAPLPPYLGQPYGYPQYQQPAGYGYPAAPGYPHQAPAQQTPGHPQQAPAPYGPGGTQPGWYPQQSPFAPAGPQQPSHAASEPPTAQGPLVPPAQPGPGDAG